MNLKTLIYNKLGNPNLFEIVKKHKLNFNFCIEAGCHDGSDSLIILEELKPKKYYAFEPDQEAYVKAAYKLEKFGGKRRFFDTEIEIFNKGLSAKSGIWYLQPTTNPGDGNSVLVSKENIGAYPVEVTSLDMAIDSDLLNGFLWLDVEGHAAEVLIGAQKILKNILLAKIEVQMHTIKEIIKLADAFKVIKILKASGLVPIFMPCHPGYFGDIYFIRKNLISVPYRMYSFSLLFLFTLLHRSIYPLLNKPK